MPYYAGEYDASGNTTYDTRDTSYKNDSNDDPRESGGHQNLFGDSTGSVYGNDNDRDRNDSSSGSTSTRPSGGAPVVDAKPSKVDQAMRERGREIIRRNGGDPNDTSTLGKVLETIRGVSSSVNDWWDKETSFTKDYNEYDKATPERKKELEEKYRSQGDYGKLSLLKETPEEREERERQDRSDRNERARENKSSGSTPAVKTITVCNVKDSWLQRAKDVIPHILPARADYHTELAKIATHIDGIEKGTGVA